MSIFDIKEGHVTSSLDSAIYITDLRIIEASNRCLHSDYPSVEYTEQLTRINGLINGLKVLQTEQDINKG